MIKCGPKRAKAGLNQASSWVFGYFIKFGSLVYLDIAQNFSLGQSLTSSRAETSKTNFFDPNCGRIHYFYSKCRRVSIQTCLLSQWTFWCCSVVGVTSLSTSQWHCWYIVNETHDDVNLWYQADIRILRLDQSDFNVAMTLWYSAERSPLDCIPLQYPPK